MAAGRADGAQTLERGLHALRMLAEAPEGLGPSEVAARLGVHRSIAHRLLTALVRQEFVTRDDEGRHRVGLVFFTLAEQLRPRLLDVARPVLHDLSNRLDATACLVVAESERAVAIAVIEPSGPGPHFSYGVGNRDPLDRGAAGIALLAAGPARDDEPARVAETRRTGHITTHEEVVAGSYGIAAPVPTPTGDRAAAINVITHRHDIAERAIPRVVEAAGTIAATLNGPRGS